MASQWADRDSAESGKRKGGGLAVLVNNRCCNPAHITIKERICSLDIELLAVGLCLYYLPREFLHVVMVTVYTPTSANPTSACDVIHSAIARLQTQHPSAFIAISGDFNHVTMVKTLPHFTQYVSCPTREERTLDLLYANVKEAYRSSPLPSLGRSDHNLVHLCPSYVPLVKRQPATTRTVRRWSEEYRKKLEWKFQQNNTREVWRGMRTINGFRSAGNRGVEGTVEQANELNLFFNRFDTTAPSTNTFTFNNTSDASFRCRRCRILVAPRTTDLWR